MEISFFVFQTKFEMISLVVILTYITGCATVSLRDSTNKDTWST